MFLVQIAMMILIISLSCFSCLVVSCRRPRASASECACIGYYTGH